jgi:16S rRNA (guanine966-N2)-methyltransferase
VARPCCPPPMGAPTTRHVLWWGGMRVIAGELKGQRLVAPRGWKVRPTSDRVREAVFSALGDVGGARVLDLYCGTGALAIEALSRGAATAVLVDRDTRPALGNVERLGLGPRAELVRTEAGRWLAAGAEGSAGTPFDLVFVDAPYRLADRVGQELNTHLPRLLAEGGRAVVESAARRPLRIDSLEPLRQRRYGATDVSFYGARRA